MAKVPPVRVGVEFDPVSLTPSQQQRAHALRAAHEVVPVRSDVTDLVDLAEYVMTGAHPLDRYPTIIPLKEQQP